MNKHSIKEGDEVFVDMNYANGGYKATVTWVGNNLARIKVDNNEWDIMINRLTPITSEIIICAAIWYKDVNIAKLNPINIEKGVVLCGHRHPHCIYQMKALTGMRTVSRGENAVGAHEQGFLTNKNRFVSREEAAIIAYIAGQIDKRKQTLYSEDIY